MAIFLSLISNTRPIKDRTQAIYTSEMLSKGNQFTRVIWCGTKPVLVIIVYLVLISLTSLGLA